MSQDSDSKGDENASIQCPSHTTERALVNKVDFRVLPMLVVLYLMAFLDRVNIANALTLGLPKDLNLVGNQSNVALTIFFVPYILFEIPSNILLRRFHPHTWLTVCMFAFGLVTLLQGFVTSYGGLLATRFFLGLTEAGIFPGCFYLLSMWYKRDEAQRRFTIFFTSTTLAGAFGSLLASAIQNMNGIRGYSGWRWIFILEGLLTCVIAIIAFVLIADFPESVQWLRTDERAFMKDRLTSENDTEDLGKALTIRHIFLIFKDYKGVLGGLMYFGTAISAYSLAYFTPTIVKSFGYGLITTQLYSVPPYAVAFVTSLAFAFASDKARIRSPFIVLGFGIWLVGIVILLAITTNTHAQYAALFLVAMGTFSSMPIVICWYTMNLQGHFQRSIGTGWIIGCGNIGGIVATFSFTNGNYHTGYGVVLGGLCLSFLTAMLYLVAVSVENRQGWDAHGRVTLGEQAMGDSREKARRNFL